jgi:DNA-binding NtrC family response regulator
MNRTILSINGNKPMNYLLQTVISDRFKFIPVSDIFQAMNEIKRKDEIELVIIDIDFDTKENWEFIHHIKTSEHFQDKQLILLTSDSEVKADAKKTYNVFLKPFSPIDLIATIDKLMSSRSVRN